MQLRRAYTEHLGRLTGTAASPFPAGVKGTDLGASFVQDGRVVFLFGDAMSDDPRQADIDLAAAVRKKYLSDKRPEGHK